MSDASEMHEEILELVAANDAVLLAHNYQRPEVQDVAGFVGDSLGLARQAARTDASVIVFAGVHFMAETAKILSPEKTVLMPEPLAGCPMADMMSAPDVAVWKDEHPGVPVVTYVNSTAEVKALSDTCCTSANAVEIVRSLGAEQVLFGPDKNLASWVARSLPDVEIIPWEGYCHVHNEVTPDQVLEAKERHSSALVMAHPECKSEVVDLADEVLSTSQMQRFAAESSAQEFIVVTEEGLLHALSTVAPGKRFVNITPTMICRNMKITTLQKVRDSLALGRTVIEVPEATRVAASVAVERMVALG